MKELTWDLKNIFNSDKDFYNEINKIRIDIKYLDRFKDSHFDSDVLFEILNFKWLIKERVNNVLIYGSLNYYKDIQSEETKKMKESAEKLVTKIDSLLSFIEEKIIELGEDTIKEYLILNEKLNTYKLYLNNIFRLRSHIQNKKTNLKIEQLKNNINEDLTKYNSIIRDIDLGTIFIDNKEIKLDVSNVSKYLSSKNREERKQTYFAVNLAYKEHSNELSEILNSIYSKRVKISELEHYSSVAEKALFDENINPIVLERLISSVQNNLSIIKKYLHLKMKFFSINEPHLYDYGVSFDNEKKYSIENAVEIINNALSPLGKKYLEIVNLLFSNNYIDALLDEKKHKSITFSWSIYSFMNYRETYIDLKNLVHELGHQINAYLSKEKQPFIYEDSTVFVGETASLINEILLNRYLYKNAKNKKDKLFYLSKNIENYFTQIFKQTMYTEFENILYKYVKNGIKLSSDLLEKEYLTLLKKYYGEHTVFDDCCSIEWARLGHLYRWNYYVYKYATGFIIASSIINLINKKKISIETYLKFLSLGSSDYSLDLLSKLKINLIDESIINDSYKILEKDINNFNKIV